MLKPVIMIGCGGSGQKAVRYVRDAVERQLEHSGWSGGVPRAWEFIALDTVVTQESPGEIPTIPASDYVNLGLSFADYPALEGALLTRFPPGSPGYQELLGWRPVATEVAIPLADGAGKIRAVGRSAGVLSLESRVRPRLQQAFTNCAAGIPELQSLSQHLDIPVPPGTAAPTPIVVVLGSNAGGTGAGIMLDVIDLVRRTHEQGSHPIAVVFSSDIFGASTSASMAANGLAFMSELMSAYWDSELSGSSLIPSQVATSNRGPHSVFVVGRKNVDGLDLGDSRNVYRAVGEALAGWVTSSQIQTNLNQFIVTNWDSAALENQGGYPFGTEHQRGVVSSFGSATISIGRDRFRDYTSKLLARQVVDFLEHGHLIRKTELIGPEADNMTPPTIVAHIVREHREGFFLEAGIHERTSRNNQITDIFVGDELGRQERSQILQELTGALQTSGLAADRWAQLIRSQLELATRSSQNRGVHDFNLRKGDWAPLIFERILRTTSEYLARFGLAVVIDLIRDAQTELHEVAAEVRYEARQDLESATLGRNEIAQSLPAGTKGSLQFLSDGVQTAVNRATSSAILQWRGETKDRVARLMEELADQVFRPMANSLLQAQQKVRFMYTTDGNEPPVVDAWPQDDGTVPVSFAPSAVEFFLEPHTSWPQRVRDLLSRSLPQRNAQRPLPGNPVAAARYLLIADEFSSLDGIGAVSRPLVWSSVEYGGRPQWTPGNAASIQVRVDRDDLFDRVRDWTMQPATALEAFLREGLRVYLSENDSNGNAVPDHQQRLSTFQQRLGETLKQSRPLFELNQALMARIHPAHPELEVRPIVQGFPFPPGHPARKTVEQQLKAYLPPEAPIDNYFTSRESESVLVSSFLAYPVHPMVVRSFTLPVNQALTSLNAVPGLIRGGFWQWCWTKVLEDAIPLPDAVRLAMIRGFAVGRLLGVVTADPAKPVLIGNPKGDPLSFPPVLLTETSADNLLPALLESFILCFGEVDVSGEQAFDPYKQLYDLGAASGESFVARGLLLDFVNSGDVPGRLIVDPRRFEQIAGGSAGRSDEESQLMRVERMVENLDVNLGRYGGLKSFRPSGQEHRTRTGAVLPEVTMTIQLLDELITGYEQVKAAVRRATLGSGV